MTDRLLIVTARYPVLGEVKSRIAAQIGQMEALEVYRKLLHMCLQTTAAVDGQKFIFFTGTEHLPTRNMAQSLGFHIEQQCAGDIGQRMHHAFDAAWSAFPGARAVLVGTDVPDLSVDIVERGFEALEKHHAVIGPANDGGYYLIGLNQPEPAVFEGMEWSTPSVCSKTLEVLKRGGKRVACIDVLHDIDYLSDLRDSQHFPEYPNSNELDEYSTGEL